jgi:thioredoxin-related protein
MSTRSLLAVLLWTACAGSPTTDKAAAVLTGRPLFLSSATAAALAAHTENKPQALLVYDSACDPCDVWDREVFTEPRVVTKLRSDAVAARIVGDRALMARFGIATRPTLLLLDSRGELLEQVDGELTTDEFLRLFDAALESCRSRQRLSELRVAIDDAKAHAAAARPDAALERYLWAFEHSRNEPTWVDMRLTGLLPELHQLARTHPAVHQALVGCRDRAVSVVRDRGRATDTIVREYAREIVAIDRWLDDLGHAERVWRDLRASGASTEVTHAMFDSDLQRHLLDSGRPADFLAFLGDPMNALERLHAPLDPDPEGKRRSLGRPEAMTLRNEVVNLGARCFEALEATGQREQAKLLADFLAWLEPGMQSYAALIVAATRRQDLELARRLAAQGVAALPPAQARQLQQVADGLIGSSK